MTPEQAWQHIKALWPDAEYIEPYSTTTSRIRFNLGRVSVQFSWEIDWSTVRRYPPAEPQYREPTQADIGKMVEVRDYANQTWRKKALLAILPSRYECRYIVDNSSDDTEACFDHFIEARIEARIAVDTNRKHCPTCKLDITGCTWCSDPYPGCPLPSQLDEQPIDTAPKDRLIWLLMGGKWVTGFFDGNIWLTGAQPDGANHSLKWDDENQPTKWRPIK